MARSVAAVPDGTVLFSMMTLSLSEFSAIYAGTVRKESAQGKARRKGHAWCGTMPRIMRRIEGSNPRSTTAVPAKHTMCLVWPQPCCGGCV